MKIAFFPAVLVGGLLLSAWTGTADELTWRAINREARPWAYNWWLGSAVDKDNLAKELKRYRDGGLGGIHIVPIYGAKGAEDRYIEFLSERWMEMLKFAVEEGGKLDLGVDMTLGTGWCFGGPHVPKEQGGWQMECKTFTVAPGEHFTARLDPKMVKALLAVAEDDQKVDLLPHLPKKFQDWHGGKKRWTVYLLQARPTGPVVKRPAPGGAGPMINPFHGLAMKNYLEPFTIAFAARDKPRANYHDSLEYRSNWSPDFLEEFLKRRGYRLQDELAAFAGKPGSSDRSARVWADYKETLSDLMIENVFPQWVAWSREQGMATRFQAHGAAGNLLDLYALADIPETEMFGRGKRDPLKSGFDELFGEGDRDPLVSMFASSAAHVAGRKLTASETGTWLAEHFCETLEEMRCLVDRLFISGVNHVFYHGCVYSPDDAAWPGWLFYASTQMNPRNPLWRDVATLNAYIARCQAILQSGVPDNQVLVYWPIHDLWHSSDKPMDNCTVHSTYWLHQQPLGKTLQQLWKRGYAFDLVSDRQLSGMTVSFQGKVSLAKGAEYQVIVVPPVQHIPLATLGKLLDLARKGACVVFQEKLPTDVPGLADLENRKAKLKTLLNSLEFPAIEGKVRQAGLGKGRILLGELEPALTLAGIIREEIADQDKVYFIRRQHPSLGFWQHPGGYYYFIANQSMVPLDKGITLGRPATDVLIMDPMTRKEGFVKTRKNSNGSLEFRLRLDPGRAIILKTFNRPPRPGPTWDWHTAGKTLAEIKGPWQVDFLAGGPQLPRFFKTDTLQSWTANGDPATEAFAGTAKYSTSFPRPPFGSNFFLDLGKVRHTARVRLNGQELGTVIMSPYRLEIPEKYLQVKENLLEIEVTNLAANRIRDLDRRKVAWRIFHDANLVNLNYRPFNAADWPIFESGLLGPVTLKSGE